MARTEEGSTVGGVCKRCSGAHCWLADHACMHDQCVGGLISVRQAAGGPLSLHSFEARAKCDTRPLTQTIPPPHCHLSPRCIDRGVLQTPRGATLLQFATQRRHSGSGTVAREITALAGARWRSCVVVCLHTCRELLSQQLDSTSVVRHTHRHTQPPSRGLEHQAAAAHSGGSSGSSSARSRRWPGASRTPSSSNRGGMQRLTGMTGRALRCRLRARAASSPRGR